MPNVPRTTTTPKSPSPQAGNGASGLSISSLFSKNVSDQIVSSYNSPLANLGNATLGKINANSALNIIRPDLAQQQSNTVAKFGYTVSKSITPDFVSQRTRADVRKSLPTGLKKLSQSPNATNPKAQFNSSVIDNINQRSPLNRTSAPKTEVRPKQQTSDVIDQTQKTTTGSLREINKEFAFVDPTIAAMAGTIPGVGPNSNTVTNASAEIAKNILGTDEESRQKQAIEVEAQREELRKKIRKLRQQQSISDFSSSVSSLSGGSGKKESDSDSPPPLGAARPVQPQLPPTPENENKDEKVVDDESDNDEYDDNRDDLNVPPKNPERERPREETPAPVPEPESEEESSEEEQKQKSGVQERVEDEVKGRVKKEFGDQVKKRIGQRLAAQAAGTAAKTGLGSLLGTGGLVLLIVILVVIILVVIILIVIGMLGASVDTVQVQNRSKNALSFYEKFGISEGNNSSNVTSSVKTSSSVEFDDAAKSKIKRINFRLNIKLWPIPEYNKRYLGEATNDYIELQNMELYSQIGLPKEVNGKKLEYLQGFTVSSVSTIGEGLGNQVQNGGYDSETNTIQWTPDICTSNAVNSFIKTPDGKRPSICRTQTDERLNVQIEFTEPVPVSAFQGKIPISFGGKNLTVCYADKNTRVAKQCDNISIPPTIVCLLTACTDPNGNISGNNNRSGGTGTVTQIGTGNITASCPISPEAGQLVCTSGYDPNRILPNGTRSPHYANDFVIDGKTDYELRAPFYGNLKPASPRSSWGTCGASFYLVPVDDNGLEHAEAQVMIAHIDEATLPTVNTVNAGQVLGTPYTGPGGNSSCWTGVHTHFEIFVDGNRIDPTDFLRVACNQPNYKCQ